MVRWEGDWLIKGVRGEYYPCKPDIFEKTYEAVHLVTKVAPSDIRGLSRKSLANLPLPESPVRP